PVLKALKMTNISMTNPDLTFTLGSVVNNIGFSLKVLKKKFGADDVLFNRDLAANEMNLSTTTEGSSVEVNTKDLGVNLVKGKYNMTARAYFKEDGVLMNKSQFGDDLE